MPTARSPVSTRPSHARSRRRSRSARRTSPRSSRASRSPRTRERRRAAAASRMNLLDAMRYLAALDQHRHFGRAASACHITQPALSNALRALEAELGVAIVRRGRMYEGLTPEGQRVLETAHRMLHEHEVLRQDLHSGIDAPRGTLAIGAVPTAIPVASRFAARLQSRHPGI